MRDYDVSFCIFCSAVILFFPQLQFAAGLLFEQFLTMSITMLLFYHIFIGKRKMPWTAIFCSMIFMNLFCIDLLRSVNFTIANDFFELIKPVSFLLYFALGYTMRFSEIQTERYTKTLMRFFVLISVLGTLEALVGSVDRLFAVIYKSPRSPLAHKAVFSFISPYCLAAMLVLPLFFYMFSFFGTKRIKYLMAFLICALCMLLTQSKTVFLGVLLTFIIATMIVFFSKWVYGRKRMIMTALVISVSAVMAFPLIIIFAEKKLSYLYIGLEVFFKAFSSLDVMKILNAQPNTRLRLEQFIFAAEAQDSVPLIGVAIGKSVLMPESFYALYLYRTGLIGICAHVLMIFFAARRAFVLSRFYAESSRAWLTAFYFSLFIFFISLVFSYFSSAVTDQTRIAFFFYFFIGHLYSCPIHIASRQKSKILEYADRSVL